MNTWVLCPNLRGARLFRYGENALNGRALSYVRELPRPHLQTRAADFAGDEELPEVGLPAEDPGREWHVALSFARYLSDMLEEECSSDAFDSLIICAEERFLDVLLAQLNHCTNSRLIGTVALDLYDSNESDLVNFVLDIVEPNRIHRAA